MEGNNGESKIRKIFLNEVNIVVIIVGLVVGTSNYFLNPSKQNSLDIQTIKLELESHEKITQQVQNLKDNDLHTLELNVNKILENQTQIQKDIVELKTLIDERTTKK